MSRDRCDSCGSGIMSHAMGGGCGNYVNAEEHGDELTFYLGKLDAAKALLRRVAEYVGHTEEPGEACTDDCLRCGIDAAVK